MATEDSNKQVLSAAIRLLHSKHSDAGAQLLRLVDDLVTKRYGEGRSVINALKEKPHLLGKDGHRNLLLGEENRPPGSAVPPPPETVYLDQTTSSGSPGVISIPDEPSSSLLELERELEVSLGAATLPEAQPLVEEQDTEAGPPRPGRDRKKKPAAAAAKSDTVSILDEVITLMDRSLGKVTTKPRAPEAAVTVGGAGATRCHLCSDGEVVRAVTCRRCGRTHHLCSVETSAPGFDPGAWFCGVCLLQPAQQLRAPRPPTHPAASSFVRVTAKDLAEGLRDRRNCGKHGKRPYSPTNLRRGARLRKFL